MRRVLFNLAALVFMAIWVGAMLFAGFFVRPASVASLSRRLREWFEARIP